MGQVLPQRSYANFAILMGSNIFAQCPIIQKPMGVAGDQDLQLHWFMLSYCNTPHATTGKAPAELFLGHRLSTRANIRAHLLRQRDEVRVQNECKPGWHPDVVERKIRKLSYEALIGGQMKQKHADQ
ncbi:hypothetical protein J437_LFUL017273 [Ladona fulva]|uniref:Uncharacterized protein n=1 Tax=Ladona fulva TaxID=123851 RepID=A0A8K0P665_LADFU|nr:hypothetical protein J437_LFUL017273 [Ladona fulva]